MNRDKYNQSDRYSSSSASSSSKNNSNKSSSSSSYNTGSSLSHTTSPAWLANQKKLAKAFHNPSKNSRAHIELATMGIREYNNYRANLRSAEDMGYYSDGNNR